MKAIYLNYHKAKAENFIIDREEFIKKYEVRKDTVTRNGETFQTIFSDDYVQPYKMLQGTPLIISIEGTYVKLDDLLQICKWKDRLHINEYIIAVKQHGFPKQLEFRWDRC